MTGMDMRRKVFLFTLLMAVVILLTEFFVLDDYLPSVRPSNRYHKKLAQQYERERRVRFDSITRTRVNNKPVATKQHAKAIAKPQNRNMAMELSNKLMDEVNSLKSRKVRKKTQIKLGGENNRVAQINSRGQKRLTKTGDQGKSRAVRMENGKRVLIYTPLFHEIPWKGIRNSYEFTHYRGEPCPVTNCSLTYRRRSFSRSDVVIFHGQDMPDSYELEKLNRRRPKGQIWIYFVLENPSNARETYYFEDMFNWTMTYEKSADIFLPYGSYAALKPDEKSPYGVINPSKKDRLVVWTVSNCGGMRDWYAQELRNHIRVDIFGSCGSYVYQPDLQEDECEKDTPECENLMKRYKFQLAFENGNCIDYVTEKYWGTPLELGIVPLVLGGANYSQMAIPGSYINVLNFDSVKALADYLLYLDKNDTAYMEYFSWRKRYKVDGYLKGSVFNDHYPWTCDICAKAQNPVSKRYKSLSDFRDSTTHCGLYEDKLSQMVHVGGNAGFWDQYTQQDDTYDEDENTNEDEDDGDEEETEDDKVVEDNEEMKGKDQGVEKGQNRDTRKVKDEEIEQDHSDKKKGKEIKTEDNEVEENKEKKTEGRRQKENNGQNYVIRKVKDGEIEQKHSDENKEKETKTEDNEMVHDREEKKSEDQRKDKGQNSVIRKVKGGETEQKRSDKHKEKETKTEINEVVGDKEKKIEGKDQREDKGQNSVIRKVKDEEIEQDQSDKKKEKETKTEDNEVVKDKEKKKTKGKGQREDNGQTSVTRKVKDGEIEQKHSDNHKEKETKTKDNKVIEDKVKKPEGRDQREDKGPNSVIRKVKDGEIEQKQSNKN